MVSRVLPGRWPTPNGARARARVRAHAHTQDPNKPLVRLYSVPNAAFEQHYSEEPLPEPEDVPQARGALADDD